MKKPKLRELREALRAVISGPYTTRFPFEPHIPPKGFRGKPAFQKDGCVGCAACAEVCPALAIKVTDLTGAQPPMRRLDLHYDKCIFCGQCELHCTTAEGIKLTGEYDLATLDRGTCRETSEHELVICEVCGAVVGARSHLKWVAQQLGAKSFANPTLIILADGSMDLAGSEPARKGEPSLARNDMMRVLCPACRRTTVLREIWGE